MEISDPAVVTISQWNIIIIEKGGKIIEKFLGYDHQRNTYRISSQIASYNPANSSGSTISGSTYSFLDDPGKLCPEAKLIFDMLESSGLVSVSLKY